MKTFCLTIILWALAFQGSLFAALPAATTWEVRTTGSDNNGGGFVAGASGTDYSQQNAAQFSGTNLASTSGTTNPCIVTSATHNFVAADVGNLIYIPAGTNWTVGRYEVVSVSSNAATLDRACGISASISGGTWAEGGALATLNTALSYNTTSNVTWVKAGSYTVIATTTIPTSVNDLSNTTPNMVLGYNASRGDNPTGSNRPTITTSTAGITLLTVSGNNWRLENFILDANSQANVCIDSSGNNLTGRGMWITNLKCQKFKTIGIKLSGGNNMGMSQIEVTGGVPGCSEGMLAGGSSFIQDSYVHANACAGLTDANTNAGLVTLQRVISANNTTAGGHGFAFYLSLPNDIFDNCIAYGNAGDGIRVNGSYMGATIRNSIVYGNTGTGINFGVSQGPASLANDYNAVGGNGTDRTNITAGTHDVALTADPFMAGASNNFTLNSTSGGGAALKNVGYPGIIPGTSSTTSYSDIGPIRHQDAGGGGQVAYGVVQ